MTISSYNPDPSQWKLIDETNGVEVEPGTQIIDFRDEPWVFHSISRSPGFSNGGLNHSNGKILVTRPNVSHPAVPNQQREFYPSVFGLKIVPA